MKTHEKRSSRRRVTPTPRSGTAKGVIRAIERLTLSGEVVVSDGRELSEAEIGALIAQLERARLAALWREMKRDYPLGAWVRSSRTPRSAPNRVVGYRYATPPGNEHRLRVRSARGVDVLLPVSDATRARPPEVER